VTHAPERGGVCAHTEERTTRIRRWHEE
jgi:hypothetical protein